MTNKQCLGCGTQLQADQPNQIGYTPNIAADVCQRCFRLKHYDDITMYVTQGQTDPRIYEQIRAMDCLVVWVVDLFDFEGSLIDGLARHIGNKDILMVGTKCDLLPATLSNEKLGRWLLRRMKQENLSVKGIVVSAYHGRDGVEEVIQSIEQLSKGRSVVFMGVANVGKSTLLNAILRHDTITTSRYPGTTLEMMKIDSDIGTLYDTPGVMRKDNIVHYIDIKDIKKVVPTKPLKPRNYQLYEPQTLSIGGICRFDFIQGIETSVTCYFNDQVKIHRSKQEKSDDLWARHYGELLQPVCMHANSFADFTHQEIQLDGKGKVDIMIHGFGWICITSEKQRISLYLPKHIGYSKTLPRV